MMEFSSFFQDMRPGYFKALRAGSISVLVGFISFFGLIIFWDFIVARVVFFSFFSGSLLVCALCFIYMVLKLVVGFVLFAFKS